MSSKPTGRRGEAMDNNYRLLDLTVYGRQEAWEDSPPGWPGRLEGAERVRVDGRPTAQWSRLEAGSSDDLGLPGIEASPGPGLAGLLGPARVGFRLSYGAPQALKV